MDLDLQYKRSLVTGAKRGIGKYIAYRLLVEDARMAITAGGEEDLNDVSKVFKA